MQLQNFYAQDANGNILPGASCTLYLAGSSSLATGLLDANGNPLPNPFSASETGLVAVSAPQGFYDLEMLTGARTGKIRVQFIDAIQVAADASSASTSASSASSSALSAAQSQANTQQLYNSLTANGGYIPVLKTVSELMAYPKTSAAKSIFLAGYYAYGDVSIGIYNLDPTDTTSAGNGGTIIVAADGGRWKLSYSGNINIKWFGAKGDGVQDDTASYKSAVSFISSVGGGTLWHPAGTYLITSSLPVGDVSICFTGAGIGSTRILFKLANAPLFDMSCVPLSSSVKEISEMSLLAGVNAAGNAIKINAVLTSASVQVNGQNDSLIIKNVTIDATNSGYWTVPVYSVNNGGIHTSGFKIQGREGVTQNNTSCRGIIVENTDSRVAIIRAISGSDTYIVRYNQPLALIGKSGGTYGGIESVYFFMGEFVGCGNTAVLLQNTVGAVTFVGTHFDAPSVIFDASNASSTFIRLVACDLRQEPNGMPLVPGPILKVGDSEMWTISGTTFSGQNASVSNPLNKAISFAATISGVQARRMAISACTFRNFYNIFSTLSTARRITESGNTYSGITNGVYDGQSNSGNGMSRYSSNQQGTVIFSLDATGSQFVSVPLTLQDATSAPSVALLQCASDTGADKLDIRYDLDSSTSTNARFLVRGNTSARNVRFSWYVGPFIQQDIVA